jgi:hypothetical protein
MKAPDSLKIIINEMLDKHWADILTGSEFDEVTYDSSYNLCKIKIKANKHHLDRTNIEIVTKWFM